MTAQAVITAAAAKAFVEDTVAKETGGPATADCGSEEVLIKDAGSTIECQVTDSEGKTGTAVATPGAGSISPSSSRIR